MTARVRTSPFWAAVLSTALAVTVASCSADPSAGGGGSDDRLTIAEPLAPDTLDPIASSLYTVDSMVWSTVYDTLATTSVDGKVVPRLAESWQVSADGRTYTFTLRKGATFHNGHPVTAQDVVHSFERAKSKGIPMVTARLEGIAEMRATSESSVTIRLSQPDATFLYTVADPSGVGVSILDDEATGDPATKPVGSGPFKFVSYSPNSHLVLERNDAHWDKAALPAYRTLEVRFVTDDQSQVAALNAGDLSLIQPVDAATVRQLRGNRTVALSSYSNLNFFVTISRIGKTAPPEVAQAVALSIDRDALVRTAFLGEAVPGSTAHPALGYGLTPQDLPNYSRDVPKAKQLLASAGYPDGVDLGFTYPTRPPFRNSFFEVLQSSLAEAGIRVRLQPVEQEVWLSRFLKADYDLSASDQSWYANPVRYVLPREGWQAPPEKAAPQLPKLLQALQAATTDETRKTAFQEVQRFEAANAYPFIGTVWANRSVAYRPDRLGGVNAESLVTGSRREFYVSLAPTS